MLNIVPKSDTGSLRRPTAHNMHPNSYLALGEKKYSVSIQVVDISTLSVPTWTKFATFADGNKQIILSVADAKTGQYTPLTKEMKQTWSDLIHRMASVERLKFVDMGRPFDSNQCSKLMGPVAKHSTTSSSRIGGKQDGKRIFPTGVLITPNGLFIKQASAEEAPQEDITQLIMEAEHTPKGEILGTGSFKNVFNAHFIPFDPKESIKDVAWGANRRLDDPLKKQRANQLLNQEGRLDSSINQQGKVVPLVQAFVEDALHPILIQEKFSMDLGEYMELEDNNITSENKVFILLELAKKIKILHDQGYSHKDIKPGNILIRSTPKGSVEVAITDLGFTNKNALHPSCGTPPFMPPTLWAKIRNAEKEFSKAEFQAYDRWAFGLIALLLLAPKNIYSLPDQTGPLDLHFHVWHPEDATSRKMKDVLKNSLLNPVQYKHYNMDHIINFLRVLI